MVCVGFLWDMHAVCDVSAVSRLAHDCSVELTCL